MTMKVEGRKIIVGRCEEVNWAVDGCPFNYDTVDCRGVPVEAEPNIDVCPLRDGPITVELRLEDKK